jgi:[ribosomal protein S5]-alanine N-acetyltransferase
MRLVTRRLILRPPTLKDAADIVENVNNLSVSRYLARVPYPYSVTNARHFIKFCREKAKDNPYNFGVTLKSSGKLIGMIGFTEFYKFTAKAEIGYWLGKKYWRQGITEEALRAFVKFAFSKLKMVRLQADAAVENKASWKLLKKVGFKKEGLRRKAERAKSTGRWHDTYSFGLLKSDVKL